MSLRPIRVVKVGGSLFDLHDLPRRLRAWHDRQSPAQTVLIAGGGRFVDALREIDRARPLGDKSAHWLAISLMEVAAEVLAGWLPESRLAGGSLKTLLETSTPPREDGMLIFAPAHFLQNEEPNLPGRKLPASWDVTGDSISARVAIVAGATELVLLKSSPPPVSRLAWCSDLKALANTGYIDPFFPLLADALPNFRFVDLRSS